MTQPLELDAPWSLHFERDGTEDLAVIYDGYGDLLVMSRPFWLPEGKDPTPATLASVQVMAVAPQLLVACQLAYAEFERTVDVFGPRSNPSRDDLVTLLRTVITEATTPQF